MKNESAPLQDALFSYKGKIGAGKVAPLGLQHVMAAIVGIVTPAMMVADRCGLSPSDKTILVQVSLIISGLATLLQLFPIFRVGSGLPVIMGVSFAYVPTMLAIGGDFGIAEIFGAQLCGGVLAFLVGILLKYIRPLFPPMVTGTVVFTIGLSLLPTAIRYMAGGGSPDTNPAFGSWQNWMVAGVTLVIVIFCNHCMKGRFKLASILLGMAGGYILALVFRMVDFSAVGDAAWLHAVKPLYFGIRFEPSAIVSMLVMYVVSSVQAIGDLSSTTIMGMDRQPTDRELSGGIKGNGIMGVLGSLIGGLPTATFNQNVGIVNVTKVINRWVFAFAAGLMLLAGLVPKLAVILTTIPQCVIGGATISVFASIAMTGIRMISSSGLTPRTVTVVGIAVALGVGVTSVPGALAGFPDWVTTVFGSSSVVISALSAIILNLILPKETTDSP